MLRPTSQVSKVFAGRMTFGMVGYGEAALLDQVQFCLLLRAICGGEMPHLWRRTAVYGRGAVHGRDAPFMEANCYVAFGVAVYGEAALLI